MTRRTPEPALASAEADSEGSLPKAELFRLLLRFGAALLVVLLIVGLLSRIARPTCEAAARAVFADYGYASLALGTLLADAFHFPVPPQFYMFMAVASQAPSWLALSAIVPASLVAGVIGYRWARLLSQNTFMLRHTARTRELLARVSTRSATVAALFASLLPLPFSLLCQLAGLNRMPPAFLLWLCVYRVPKLLAFFALIYLGWHPG